MQKGEFNFVTPSQPEQYKEATVLFEEYAASLDIDLCFQGFKDELSAIDQQYGVPFGALVLIYHYDTPVGCAAIRRLAEGTAELKRMYIRPDFLNRGLGTLLIQRMIDMATALGYCRIRLDTLATMHAARQLYQRSGFYEIDAYCYNPHSGVIYMEKNIGDAC